ncbi:WD40-repeat-containing domain protein [Fomes fomentarius]|nr:WD40-repeat-containing domain protein [Fomes fomentarius]
MHLMPHTTLLAASLQYGVVSRSYPLSGKILRGYLDASGTLNGLGIGNPNAEFSPHVTSIAMASEGGTAKILWGFRNGEVAVTTAVRTMDPSRTSASRLIRCRPGDCHEGAVECVSWATGIEGYVFFVSGGADGRVKLWEAKTTLKCLWNSNKQPSLVPDPCVKAVMDMQQAVIAAGFRNGGLLVWTGLGALAEASDSTTLEPRELRIPAPTATATPALQQHENTAQELTRLCIAPREQCLSLLAIYHPSHHCHRLTWNDTASAFERTLFGDDNSGPITAVYPVWGSRPDECDFVITGDQLGTISIYSWTAGPSSPTSTASASSAAGAEPVRAVRRFAAHEDGAVTALAWNSAVLVSGSSRGTIKVWDALTLAPLRTFTTPSARPLPGAEWDAVGQILLERDALIVSIGKAVLAWKAGPAGKNVGHGKGKGVRAGSGKNANGVAKWQQQIEMYRDIAESQRELEEERRHFRRTFGREKEQLSTLAHLGLSEVEAVEYVLMLSRDEEEARRMDRPRAAESSRYGEEGVFLVDFDDVPTPMATPSNVFRSEPSSVAPSRTSSTSVHSSPSSDSYTSGFQGGHSFPRRTPSSSNHKIQVSPRARPEPMEAGFRMSPLPSRSVSSSSGVPPQTSDLDHFPVVPVSRTPSSTSASGSSSSVRGSAPGSPQSIRSAWNTPLRTLHPSGVPSPSRVGSAASPSQSPSRSVAGAAWRPPPSSSTEDDEELRFAIELSLAEARSRGADV